MVLDNSRTRVRLNCDLLDEDAIPSSLIFQGVCVTFGHCFMNSSVDSGVFCATMTFNAKPNTFPGGFIQCDASERIRGIVQLKTCCHGNFSNLKSFQTDRVVE